MRRRSLLDKIEQVVRLIRSKGVGVYFVTQNPLDVPETVLGQLGNRVQHALRAFTPRDQKAVKAAAETMRPNPKIDTEKAITELGVGEALVSFLDAKGRPAVVERAYVLPPGEPHRTGDAGGAAARDRRSALAGVYDKPVDRESAYERLKGRAGAAAPAGSGACGRRRARRRRQLDRFDQGLARRPPVRQRSQGQHRRGRRQERGANRRLDDRARDRPRRAGLAARRAQAMTVFTMRAVRYDRYGPPDVLQVVDVADPAPGKGAVKVRVRAVGLNPLDWKIRAGHTRFIPAFKGPPRGVGTDFAGEIVGIGGNTGSRHVGERVFGSLLPFGREGALAEYVVASVGRLIPIPDGIDYDQAAALPIAGGTALQALTDEARLASRQRALITGAAGGVGHFAVQIAKHLGAYVVAVCSHGNADWVRALGADEVVDYAREDFTRRDDRFDVIFDAAGASTFAAARRVLTDSGCYVNTLGDAKAVANTVAGAIVARLTSRQRVVPFALKNVPALWQRLAAMTSEGVLRAHVERAIALEDVADAQRAMETGHGRGKIVVRL